MFSLELSSDRKDIKKFELIIMLRAIALNYHINEKSYKYKTAYFFLLLFCSE